MELMKTPDPITTTEALASAVATLAGLLITLFGLDLTDTQKGVISPIILTVFAIFAFLHGAYVRGKRAQNANAVANAKLLAPSKPKKKAKSNGPQASQAEQASLTIDALQRRIETLEAQAKPVIPPPPMQPSVLSSAPSSGTGPVGLVTPPNT
jgi:hypothetical protein